MKRVIQVVQHLSPGGIETMVLDLASHAERQETTLILSLEGEKESSIAAWPRLVPYANQLIFLDKKPGLRPALILALGRLFKDLDADVVHTHHIGPLLYAGLAARLAGVPKLIHTEHDAWHLNDPRRCALQRAAIFLTRPRLIADAQTVADAMKSRLKTSSIRIVRNGIDTERFIPGDQEQARRQLGLPLKVSLIGCGGRLEKVKGQHLLIEALARMPGQVHLALAGSGSTEGSLREQANRLGLTERVHMLGRIDEMPTFYQALDLFCLPSLNEGFPLSPLEAQACDIRTAVTDVGGSSETLCPHSGELIPKGDAQAMATSLRRMLDRPTSINPRQHIQQHGDVRQMARAYAELRETGV